MTEHFDRIVIGGGAMGLATAWQLASRGVRVLVLEQFGPGHAFGASHGATRNMNNAYAEPYFLDLYDEALTLWRELEADSGEQLLTLGGLVSHGEIERVRPAHATLAARGGATELISPAEAEARWPGMRFEGEVLVNRDAGRIHSATALEVLDRLSRERGAELHYGERVVEISLDAGADSAARVRVVTEAGSTEAGSVATGSAETGRTETGGTSGAAAAGARREYTADGLVVTAGAWTSGLLGDVVPLPPLRVTEEHPAHFAPSAAFEAAHPGAEWPSFNHFQPESRHVGYRGQVYGMLTPGEGVKVGFHATGDEVDPDARRFRASDEAREQLREYVAEWFPGLDPDSAVEVSCTYTLTASSDFILDRVGLVTVGAGFSGQGFKFVPAIGRVLADATLGLAEAPEAFRLSAHSATRASD